MESQFYPREFNRAMLFEMRHLKPIVRYDKTLPKKNSTMFTTEQFWMSHGSIVIVTYDLLADLL